MDQPEHRRKDVESYLLGQLRDDGVEVVHVELIQQQWVGADRHEIWDCHTREHGRWWVIGPFLNLYSQDAFKSADQTLTFHIGLIERMMWKGDGPAGPREGLEPLCLGCSGHGSWRDAEVEASASLFEVV